MKTHSILSNVKDTSLILKRRNQIVKGAISLFKQKGFHRTTTKEIAQESGFSIGTLYEYIRAKEDVLFLVYEAINDQVHGELNALMNQDEQSMDTLVNVIDSYYRLMDDMQDEVTILYQEIKSLETTMRGTVLQRERDKVLMLKNAIINCVPHPISEEEAELIANNVFVQGHMWGFRSWILNKQFTIDTYIDMQINFVFKVLGLPRGK